MKSSEFRRVYANLTEPTEVTVNGHVIGQWVPARLRAGSIGTVGEHGPETFIVGAGSGTIVRNGGYSTRPFTPVPKRATRG